MFENLKLQKVEIDKLKNLKTPIIFDTNFLFLTFETKVDIIFEINRLFSNNYSLFIFEHTILELENILNRKDKSKKVIRLVCKFLTHYGFRLIKNSIKYIDNAIIENLDEKIIVATIDRELKKKIKQTNPKIKILILRQKSYLEIT